jgi:hypothetical protein
MSVRQLQRAANLRIIEVSQNTGGAPSLPAGRRDSYFCICGASFSQSVRLLRSLYPFGYLETCLPHDTYPNSLRPGDYRASFTCSGC